MIPDKSIITIKLNIIQIYELLHDHSNYYIVSEWIKGGDLYDFCNSRKSSIEDGALSESEVIVIAK